MGVNLITYLKELSTFQHDSDCGNETIFIFDKNTVRQN
jgi:hypothetical protein